jgi:predicted phage terminase large subunit-like protein
MMPSLSQWKRELLAKTILQNKWIPHQPTLKQAEFLVTTEREVLYGGAAGGGKSDALLMAALQFVAIPGYTTILFRRTYKDLSLPEALMDRAQEWLGGTDAKWSGENHTWTFPSSARLCFGYMETEADKYRYQSAAFQLIGFDEVTQFLEAEYRFMFSRLRRLEMSPVPLRMRAASNPGGVGHEWVKQRFLVEGAEKGRIFIPAKLEDNPYLDQVTYRASLNELDPITREQLLNGDWSARNTGGKFRREWFKIVDDYPKDALKVRYWDLAATEPGKGRDPDYTVGALLTQKVGIYYIIDIKRMRGTPAEVEALIRQTAELDGKETEVHMETEPGSAGISNIDHYARHILLGFSFHGQKTTGSKELRANPVSSAAEAGNIRLVRGPWINDFLDEAEAFPRSPHDDQVDAVSGAFTLVAKPKTDFGAFRFG